MLKEFFRQQIIVVVVFNEQRVDNRPRLLVSRTAGRDVDEAAPPFRVLEAERAPYAITLIDADTLMQAAERVLVGNVNSNTTKERERDRRIIAIHEWGHFLVDFELERKRAGSDWEKLQAEMKTIKISLKANPRNNALGFVFHKQGANLLKTKSDIEHDVRVLLGGMANEELFFGE